MRDMMRDKMRGEGKEEGGRGEDRDVRLWY